MVRVFWVHDGLAHFGCQKQKMAFFAHTLATSATQLSTQVSESFLDFVYLGRSIELRARHRAVRCRDRGQGNSLPLQDAQQLDESSVRRKVRSLIEPAGARQRDEKKFVWQTN